MLIHSLVNLCAFHFILKFCFYFFFILVCSSIIPIENMSKEDDNDKKEKKMYLLCRMFNILANTQNLLFLIFFCFEPFEWKRQNQLTLSLFIHFWVENNKNVNKKKTRKRETKIYLKSTSRKFIKSINTNMV